MILNNVRIPRSHLLNKQGDVTVDGKYISQYADKSKHFGAVLGTLSGGRISILGATTCDLITAITIAIRFENLYCYPIWYGLIYLYLII